MNNCMSTCAQCGAMFECGAVDPGAAQPCWCTQLPPLPVDAISKENAATAHCYCPSCLRALLASSNHPASA